MVSLREPAACGVSRSCPEAPAALRRTLIGIGNSADCTIVLETGADKLTFQSPELWVYMLGLSTLLGAALRRERLKYIPLSDELYSKSVAIDHVQSGVAWIRSDGLIRTVNESLASMLRFAPRELQGRTWYELFEPEERSALEEAYSRMLLIGKTPVRARARRADGTFAEVDVLMVAVHDHKSRLIGHYCMVADRSRECLLEQQLRERNGSPLDA